eukprot:UN17572
MENKTETLTFRQIFGTNIIFIFSSLIFIYSITSVVDVYYSFYLTDEFGIAEKGNTLIQNYFLKTKRICSNLQGRQNPPYVISKYTKFKGGSV